MLKTKLRGLATLKTLFAQYFVALLFIALAAFLCPDSDGTDQAGPDRTKEKPESRRFLRAGWDHKKSSARDPGRPVHQIT